VTSENEHRLRVLENRMLRRMFGPKWEETIRGYRKLHKEKLHNLSYSPNIIRMIRSRRMQWAVPVAGIGEKKSDNRVW
jgi:hypothetical protein